MDIGDVDVYSFVHLLYEKRNEIEENFSLTERQIQNREREGATRLRDLRSKSRSPRHIYRLQARVRATMSRVRARPVLSSKNSLRKSRMELLLKRTIE